VLNATFNKYFSCKKNMYIVEVSFIAFCSGLGVMVYNSSGLGVMVYNTTFNNILIITCESVVFYFVQG
jgi:hypothetical protein